jgi:hypothetical protein
MTAETAASSADDSRGLAEEFVLFLAVAHYDGLAQSAATAEERAAARAKCDSYEQRLLALVRRQREQIAARIAACDAQVHAQLKTENMQRH